MRTSRRSSVERAARVTAALMVALATRPLAAAEPEREQRVALAVRTCAEPFEWSLRRILALELGELLDESGSAASGQLESLEIACEAGTASITARGAGGGEEARNALTLDAFPGDAAPRAVALAALEALRTVDPTLAERIEARRAKARSDAVPSAAGSTRHVAPEAPARRERSRPTRLESPPFTRVTLGGIARAFLSEPASTSVGARLELSRRLTAPFDLGFDLDGTFSRREVSLGVVHATLLSAAAWMGVRVGNAAWSATAGLGARAGLALLRGAPGNAARGQASARPVAGPMLILRGDGVLGPIALALVLEGGLALASAEGLANGTAVAGFQGPWAAVSPNVGLRF